MTSTDNADNTDDDRLNTKQTYRGTTSCWRRHTDNRREDPRQHSKTHLQQCDDGHQVSVSCAEGQRLCVEDLGTLYIRIDPAVADQVHDPLRVAQHGRKLQRIFARIPAAEQNLLVVPWTSVGIRIHRFLEKRLQ